MAISEDQINFFDYKESLLEIQLDVVQTSSIAANVETSSSIYKEQLSESSDSSCEGDNKYEESEN
ncbi:6390_t:CDS:2 [Ambispora leptoticha]|uniref:6390_t:CDS:1 n=1 Tax=Ambispora leptoticha TaxID=144679 RepID=A0A9N9BPI0_9GLOM|nr:6390_t:CDS:2 [Ambispora leptoticha]